jgi:uncharacterized protein
MLIYHVSQVPTEGLEVDADLDLAILHMEGENGFAFRSGHVTGRIDKGDEDSLHLRGRFTGVLALECGRCLVGYTVDVDQQLDLIYLRHQVPQGGQEEDDEVELSDRDVVVGYYSNDRLDVGESLREQIYLNLPLARVCKETCRGLCPSCGQDLNQRQCGCVRPAAGGDPRLALLGELLKKK